VTQRVYEEGKGLKLEGEQEEIKMEWRREACNGGG